LLQRQKTASGIPDTAKENHKKGTVVVGNGTKEHNDCENWLLFFTENMLELN
jgi:co-chaperonin GroES (HSP10)